ARRRIARHGTHPSASATADAASAIVTSPATAACAEIGWNVARVGCGRDTGTAGEAKKRNSSDSARCSKKRDRANHGIAGPARETVNRADGANEKNSAAFQNAGHGAA